MIFDDCGSRSAGHQSTPCSVRKRPKGEGDVMRHPLFARPEWTRRDFLQRSAAVAAGVYGMRSGPRPMPLKYRQIRRLEVPAGGARAQSQTRRRAAHGHPDRPPHFDLHQSGTIFNLGAMGCMFDNLIRRDPRDGGKTIIPDLAHSWEIAKDGKTYTFFLRKDVQFHDGGGADRRGRESHLRPHRQAAVRASASRAASCSNRSARSTRATNTPSNSNCRSRARSTS